MYAVTAEEMRNLDRKAIAELGIPGIVLMENAGLRVVEVIENILGDTRGKRITVFAGKGNNGGDGFVVARHLLNRGAEVKVLLLAKEEDIAGDALVNLNILKATGQKVYSILNVNNLNIVRMALGYTDLVVDALFGTGFQGKVDEYTGNIISVINEAQRPTVAVDIPSGLEADTGKAHGPCIKATHTVTFALPKLGLVLYPGASCVGELIVGDISIPASLFEQEKPRCKLINLEMAASLIPPRNPESHKGDYGRVVIAGGSEGLTGAVALAGEGCLRAGAGLVTAAVPGSLNPVLEMKLTEVMTRPLADKDGHITADALPAMEKMVKEANALALGPGLGMSAETVEFVHKLLPKLEIPTVIDADGLNALAQKVSLLEECQAPLVLTPHPGEMARLLGVTIEEVQAERIKVAGEAARYWKAVVVLKGARTVIAGPEGETYINLTGNPGLATGGSGDVLTGIIAGLLGQGLTPLEAAAAGVYLHGRAGDLQAVEKGEAALLAGDLLLGLPVAFKELREETRDQDFREDYNKERKGSRLCWLRI